MRLPLALIALLLLPATLADAQLVKNTWGTHRVGFGELRTGGKLAGCELQFDQLIKDNVASPTRAVWVDGVIALMARQPGDLVLLIKVVPFDLSQTKTQVHKAPFDPVFAYAVLSGVSTAGREAMKFRCEDGGFCAFYSDQELLMAHLKTNLGFRLSYQRINGDADVAMDIAFPTPDQPEWADFRAFSQCQHALLQGVVKSLQ